MIKSGRKNKETKPKFNPFKAKSLLTFSNN